MHALIIEDDWLIALHLEALLGQEGFRSCAMAESEEMAVAAAAERHPDIITADLQLRSGTGLAAVEAICARRPVPVVYVTGNPRELAHLPSALVVAKPFTEPMLQRVLRKAMARMGTLGDKMAPAVAPAGV